MIKAVKSKQFKLGCLTGVIVSVAAYTGHVLYENHKKQSKYDKQHQLISQTKYSENEAINRMLHAIATIIALNEKGYLSTINNEDRSEYEYPLTCIIHKTWAPPVTIPYIFIGINKKIDLNNNAVLTFNDMQGEGYVSLYGQIINANKKQKLLIHQIEFVAPRFGFDAIDTNPLILKRVESTLKAEKAKWIRARSGKKWRTNYSGYLVFDDNVK
eukprot:UN01538